jgi:hypothetical protein
MDQRPSSAYNSLSGSQETSRILLNPKVHHRVHNSLQLGPILEPDEFSPHPPTLFP